MLIDTNGFWNYIVDEPEVKINNILNCLTRKDWDFDNKKYDISNYYQIVSTLKLEQKDSFGNDIDRDYIIRFPRGLTKWLTSKINFQIEEQNKKLNLYTEKQVIDCANEIHAINNDFEIRDYQIEATLTSLNSFQSLIVSGVGSGKTSIMSMVCKLLSNDKILILNGNNFILQQIYDRLISVGISQNEIDFNKGDTPDFSKRIVLFNTKGSNNRLREKNEDYINFLGKVNTIIWDECQHIQSLTNFEPIFYTNEDNLQRLIGYSGSPFRNHVNPYSNQQDYLTIALLGEPAFTYGMKNTIENGNIAKVYSYFIRYKNKKAWLPPQFKDNYFMQYRMNITYNKERNKAGLEMIRFLNKNNIKTLVSFNNIKPGQAMMKALKQEGIKAVFICGDETIYEWIETKGKLKLEERHGDVNDIKQVLQKNYNIILASQVFDEGVDISEFQACILFSAGKSPISNIQRIGRASRRKADGKNIAFAIDFKDVGGESMFQNHYEKRKKLMEDSGIENIVDVLDFCKLVESCKLEKEN